MLSFNELQEKKTKIKINPKKEEMMEGDKTLNHGDDCNCMKCDKKRRKDDLGDEKTVSTEELAYDSQEEVSEESNQEIAETEKTVLTFDQFQYAQTLDEEQLQEFLKGLFGGGSKVLNTATPSPSQRAVSGLQNQARQGNLMGSGMIANTAQKMMNRRDQQAAMMKQLLGRSKGGLVKKKIKKEEVELVNEMPLPGAGSQGANVGSSSGGGSRVGGTPANASTAALALGKSKGGLVKKKKSYKESMEFFEDRAADAQKSLDKVKKRQKVLDKYEKDTGRKADIKKTPEYKQHKMRFPGAKRTGKKVPGAKETELQQHNRRVSKHNERLIKHGPTKKEAERQKGYDAYEKKHKRGNKSVWD